MRAAGSLSRRPKMRAINRAVIWTPGRHRPAYKISNAGPGSRSSRATNWAQRLVSLEPTKNPPRAANNALSWTRAVSAEPPPFSASAAFAPAAFVWRRYRSTMASAQESATPTCSYRSVGNYIPIRAIDAENVLCASVSQLAVPSILYIL